MDTLSCSERIAIITILTNIKNKDEWKKKSVCKDVEKFMEKPLLLQEIHEQ